MGTLRLHFKAQYGDDGSLISSRVTLGIHNGDRPVYFTGTVAKMDRPGFVTLSIPPEESWREPLRLLTREQQERFSTAEFYQMLQTQITRRYLALPPERSGKPPRPSQGEPPTNSKQTVPKTAAVRSDMRQSVKLRAVFRKTDQNPAVRSVFV